MECFAVTHLPCRKGTFIIQVIVNFLPFYLIRTPYWDRHLFCIWKLFSFPPPPPPLFCSGLRTLCYAVANVSEASYAEWCEGHQRASTSLTDRALKVEESYQLIETVSDGHHCISNNPSNAHLRAIQETATQPPFNTSCKTIHCFWNDDQWLNIPVVV